MKFSPNVSGKKVTAMREKRTRPESNVSPFGERDSLLCNTMLTFVFWSPALLRRNELQDVFLENSMPLFQRFLHVNNRS